MNRKRKKRILTTTTIGSTHVGGSMPNGKVQPPKKSVAVRAYAFTMLGYSAANKAAKRPPPYSVL
jgi:hypothetical protein